MWVTRRQSASCSCSWASKAARRDSSSASLHAVDPADRSFFSFLSFFFLGLCGSSCVSSSGLLGALRFDFLLLWRIASSSVIPPSSGVGDLGNGECLRCFFFDFLCFLPSSEVHVPWLGAGDGERAIWMGDGDRDLDNEAECERFFFLERFAFLDFGWW